MYDATTESLIINGSDNKVAQLPKWVVTDNYPAFYDMESHTVVEQTAKLYGAMRNLIDEYNLFVNEMTARIDIFENDTKDNTEDFQIGLRQEFQDFIDKIELIVIEAQNYMKTHLQESADKVLGDIVGEMIYDREVFEQDREFFRQEHIAQTNAINKQNQMLSIALTNLENAIETQDNKVNEAVDYLTTNLHGNITTVVNNMIENGEIVVGLTYNETDESVMLNARNTVKETDLLLNYDEENEAILIEEV